MYIFNVVRTCYRILSSRALRWFASLQVFYLLSALMQVFGIASIGPFVAIISNPAIIHSHSALSKIYTSLHFTSDKQFIISSACLSIFMILVSNLVAGLTYGLSFRFSVHIGNLLLQRNKSSRSSRHNQQTTRLLIQSMNDPGP